MLRTMERRGPDGEGLVRSGRVILGHRRLAIIDLDPRANQPLSTTDRRFLISFNGEIYNYRELMARLGLSQDDLRTKGDTEIVLHAWAAWGRACLDQLVGQFALAIYDRFEDELWLARDRFGEKPLYYHQCGAALSFASTMGALLELPWIERALDPSSVREYLTYRYCIAPRTVVRGIQKLPAGHLLRVRYRRPETHPWYRGRFGESNARTSRRDLVEEFDSLLNQATKRCLVGDVDMGLFLSDGIDSSAIHRCARSKVPAYTFISEDSTKRNLEPPAEATRIECSSELRLTALERAFSTLTEPVGDGAIVGTWLLFHAAKEHATVFLCGHGADELLAGYRLSQDRFRLSAIRRLAWLPDSVVGRLVTRYSAGGESVTQRRHRFLSMPGYRAAEAARYVINRPLPKQDLDALCPSARSDESGSSASYLEAIDRLYDDQPAAASNLDRIQNVMLKTFLTENILSWADSVAMDNSCELRMPFLDRDLVEFIFGLPDDARIGRLPGRRNTKLVLRWWGEGRLDQAVLRRRKRPFFAGGLRSLHRKHPRKLRSWITESDALREAVPGLETWMDNGPEFFRGPRQGTLWALLALGIWSRSHGIS